MTAAARERRALLLAFGVFGGFWGAWAALLPSVQHRTGVDDRTLGLALGAVALAALPAMPLAGRLVDRYGVARLLPRCLLAFAVVGPLPGLARGVLPLVLALVLLGATTGALDVVVNAATASWERLEADRLMAAAHGCFSVGVLFGSVATGVARDAGASPLPVLLVVAAVLLAGALAQPDHRRPPVVQEAAPGRARLGRSLLLLGVLVAGAFLVEDAVQSWSALRLEHGLSAPPWVGGLGPGLFAGTMAVGRFGAHAVVTPGREARAVGAGGALLAAGTLLLALAPVAAVGLFGVALAGAGTSVLAPVLFSAVGARSAPGRQGADLGAVTTLGYVGFVAGPPLVGLVSGATSLPVALGLLAVVGTGLALGGPLLLRPPADARLAG